MNLECYPICACQRFYSDNVEMGNYGWDTDQVINISSQECALKELTSSGNSGNESSSVTVKLNAIMNGYLSPPVIILTTITNILVCIVLTKKNMRTPTNIILLVMAFVDMLTGVTPLPWYLLMEHFNDSTLKAICSHHHMSNTFQFMSNTLPTIFHTISIWLSVILAVQRWIYIYMGTAVTKVCTIRNSIITIGVLSALTSIFILFLHFYLGSTVFSTVYPIVNSSFIDSKGIIVSCIHTGRHRQFIISNIARTFLVNIIPIVLLIIFTILLIAGLRKIRQRRKSLFADNRSSNGKVKKSKNAAEKRRSKDTASTTRMLIIVVVIFLVVEIPMTVITTLYILMSVNKLESWVYEYMPISITIVNFIILVSYPLNFFIYCLMSTQFRDTFAGLFPCCSCKNQVPHRMIVEYSTAKSHHHHQNGDAKEEESIAFVPASPDKPSQVQ